MSLISAVLAHPTVFSSGPRKEKQRYKKSKEGVKLNDYHGYSHGARTLGHHHTFFFSLPIIIVFTPLQRFYCISIEEYCYNKETS